MTESKAQTKIPALREIIEERKEKAIDTLSASYAKNRLPLEEYERLAEYINKIESERELAVVEKIVAEYDEKDAPDNTDWEQPVDDYDEDDTGYNSPQRHNVALLSSRVFTGPVKSGSQFVSMLGSQRIKIRKVDLKSGRTFLEIVTILGDSVIYVEEGIRVTIKAVPILGSAWVNEKVNRALRGKTGEKELVINGAALLGSINVKLLKE